MGDLENCDNISQIGTYDTNSVKELIVNRLVMEFRCSLNHVFFGDPAGKDYIEGIEKLKQSKGWDAFKLFIKRSVKPTHRNVGG